MKQFEHNGIKYHTFYGKSKHQYVLDKTYGVYVDIKPAEECFLGNRAFLNTNGKLIIRSEYGWNRPFWSDFDTKNAMRGGLVHGVLYDLMRYGELNADFRQEVDDQLYYHLVADGVWRWRARYIWLHAKTFGVAQARPCKK